MNIAAGCSKASFSPQYIFEAVSALEVQQALRQMFDQWGIPKRLRVDNGPPSAHKSDLPSPLCLWLIGLGIEVIHNRPYRPQENGKVERSHGVAKNWIEPSDCEDLAQLQTRLIQAATIQREQYPSIAGRTRVQAYGELAHRARPYDSSTEADLWQLSPVLKFLAGHRWTRKVSCTGQISWYGRNLGVGRNYKTQMVTLRFDSESIEWVIEDALGEEAARYQVQGLTFESISQLNPFASKPLRIFKGGA